MAIIAIPVAIFMPFVLVLVPPGTNTVLNCQRRFWVLAPPEVWWGHKLFPYVDRPVRSP
jgi:hypothetical protein